MHYEIGYRPQQKGEARWTTPYTDLPPIKNEDEAMKLYRQLVKDFPSAEWRIVECRP